LEVAASLTGGWWRLRRLRRAYSGHVETLRRLRHGSDQYVRVEHVHISEGGQAVSGNVRALPPDLALAIGRIGLGLLGGDPPEPNAQGTPDE